MWPDLKLSLFALDITFTLGPDLVDLHRLNDKTHSALICLFQGLIFNFCGSMLHNGFFFHIFQDNLRPTFQNILIVIYSFKVICSNFLEIFEIRIGKRYNAYLNTSPNIDFATLKCPPIMHLKPGSHLASL